MSSAGQVNLSGLSLRQREIFNSRKTSSIEWRRSQLKAMIRMLEENEHELAAAHHSDLRSTKLQRYIEVDSMIDEAKWFLHHLDRLAKDRDVPLPVMFRPGNARVIRQPFGSVLIIGPWNYPIILSLGPVIGAIAAGNCVVLKPSEVASNVSRILAQLVPKYMDSDCIKVVEGGVEETTNLLKQKWDYIFYTGNTHVGRIVMRAAAEHLTPVTLELGGKNPTIIDSDVDIDIVCTRISMAKWLNNGQTCVAPDTIYVHSKVADKFTEKMKSIIAKWYQDASKSPDWSRIINSRHAQRVAGLLEGVPASSIIAGGQADPSDHYVAPTLVTDPPKDSKLLKEEIFGPIVPILKFDNVDEILPELAASDYPLAVYVFSRNKAFVDYVIKNTDSGAVTVNDALIQLAVRDLPFGGVGASGMGRWFREASYNTFTYERGVFDRPLKSDPDFLHPPFTDNKVKWFRRLAAGFGALERVAPSARTLMTAAAVAGLAISVATYPQHIQAALMQIHDAIGVYLIKK